VANKGFPSQPKGIIHQKKKNAGNAANESCEEIKMKQGSLDLPVL